MSKYALSKWFANGSGHVIRLHNSDVLLFQWNGHPDHVARIHKVDDKVSYERNGKILPSLAGLLRAVEAEHS